MFAKYVCYVFCVVIILYSENGAVVSLGALGVVEQFALCFVCKCFVKLSYYIIMCISSMYECDKEMVKSIVQFVIVCYDTSVS